MNTLHVKELNRRYRIKQASLDLKPELDRLSEHFFREFASSAIQDAGHRANNVLCIKLLHLPITYTDKKADSEHYHQWLVVMTQAIAELFSSEQGANWIVYPSKVAVLTSALSHILINDTSDQWAWKQVGIVKETHYRADEMALDCWHYLSDKPEYLSPVLWFLHQHDLFIPFIKSGKLDQNTIIKLGECKLALEGKSINWERALHTILSYYDDSSEGNLALRQSLSSSAPGIHIFPQGFVHICYELCQILQQTAFVRASTHERIKTIQSLCFVLNMPQSNMSLLGLHSETRIVSAIGQLIVQITQLGESTLKRATKTVLSAQQTEPTKNGLDEKANTVKLTIRKNDDLTELNDNQLDKSPDITSKSAFLKEDIDTISRVKKANDEAQKEHLYSDFAGLMFVHNVLKQSNWKNQFASLLCEHISPCFALRALAQNLLPKAIEDPVISLFDGSFLDTNIPIISRLDTNAQEQWQLQLISFASQLKLAIVSALMGVDMSTTHQQNSTTNHHLIAEIDEVFEQLCNRYACIEHGQAWVTMIFDMQALDSQIRKNGLDFDLEHSPFLPYQIRFCYE